MGTQIQWIGTAAATIFSGLTAVGLAAPVAGQPADLAAQTLRCEYLNDPIGVDEPTPRLS